MRRAVELRKQSYAETPYPTGSSATEEVPVKPLEAPLDVLADTLHAFPTTARVLGTLFAKAAASR